MPYKDPVKLKAKNKRQYLARKDDPRYKKMHNAAANRYRQKHREQGLCEKCPRKIHANRLLCKYHIQVERARNRKRWDRHKQRRNKIRRQRYNTVEERNLGLEKKKFTKKCKPIRRVVSSKLALASVTIGGSHAAK